MLPSLTILWCRLRHQHRHHRTTQTLPNGYQFTAVWCEACGGLSVSQPFNPFSDVERSKYEHLVSWDREGEEVAAIAKELRSVQGERDSPERDLAHRVEAIGYALKRKTDLLRQRETFHMFSWLCVSLVLLGHGLYLFLR